ncbi:MAG: DUF6524 family protein, partial [Pseudomonadales bacterium]
MSYAQVRKKLPLTSFVLRIFLVAALVFATVNPSKYTLTTWLLASSAPMSVRIFLAFSLFAVWMAILRIAWQGLRAFGFSLVLIISVFFGLLEVQFELLRGLSEFSLSLLTLCAVTAV